MKVRKLEQLERINKLKEKEHLTWDEVQQIENYLKDLPTDIIGYEVNLPKEILNKVLTQ